MTLAVPTGDPADPATTAGITAVLGEMAACLTAGDMLRFYALHSDDWLGRSLGVVEGMAIQTMSIPTLDDGNYARYLGPWYVKILSYGRVLAAVLLVVGDDLRPDPNRVQSCSSSTMTDAGWLMKRSQESSCQTARPRSRSPPWWVRHRGRCSPGGLRRAASDVGHGAADGAGMLGAITHRRIGAGT
jgi:hypothetical protein